MFDVGQQVAVITDKGIAYEAVIIARAWSDEGVGAYKVVQAGNVLEQTAQWHKSSDVFVLEHVEGLDYAPEEDLVYAQAHESELLAEEEPVAVPVIDEANAPWKSFLKD